MSIRAVFRVQCDGPGKEWLSLPEGYVMGTDIRSEQLVTSPTAERAGNWPGERAARTAAKRAGWVERVAMAWLCPACAENPLGIELPPNEKPLPLSAVCVCDHTMNWHNFNRLCTALPGTTGCGCLGFKRKEGRDEH